MITVRDDNVLRTHDEAQNALRGECDRLGARVEIDVIRGERKGDKFARYVVTLERFGQRPLSSAAVYSVPCAADKLLEHVQTMVKGAAAQAEKDK